MLTACFVYVSVATRQHSDVMGQHALTAVAVCCPSLDMPSSTTKTQANKCRKKQTKKTKQFGMTLFSKRFNHLSVQCLYIKCKTLNTAFITFKSYLNVSKCIIISGSLFKYQVIFKRKQTWIVNHISFLILLNHNSVKSLLYTYLGTQSFFFLHSTKRNVVLSPTWTN